MADGTPGGRAGKRRYVRSAHVQRLRAVQRLCRRLEMGESLTEACRCPTMPARSTLMSWLAREPELAALVEAAEATAAQLFTPRREYHRFEAAVAEEVLARIEAGRGLREVCAEPDMPAAATVTRWLNTRPEFLLAYRRAREMQADRLFDLAWRIACEAEPGEVETARLKIQTLKWRVARLAPYRFGPLKAVEPPPPAIPVEGAEAGGRGGQAQRLLVSVRGWAVGPDGEVVEITRASRGLDAEGVAELERAVAEGRFKAGDDWPPPG